MSIACTCPKCGQLCGFRDEYKGRTARCLECGTRFIIPQENGQKGIPVISKEDLTPLPGFYRAVLIDSWKVIFCKDNLAGLILCAALTCFHFFVGDADYSFTIGHFRPPLFVGWVATFIAAGYLLWYFMETIQETAMNNDFLPDISIGGGFVFIMEAFKSIYFFLISFIIAALPGIAYSTLMSYTGFSNKWLNLIILLISLFSWPMMLSMFGANVTPTRLFRYDLVIQMIIKTFRPYVLTTAIAFTALLGIYLTVGFFSTNPDISRPHSTIMLSARLIAVYGMLFAMRTIGLYVRHYFVCLPQLTTLISN